MVISSEENLLENLLLLEESICSNWSWSSFSTSSFFSSSKWSKFYSSYLSSFFQFSGIECLIKSLINSRYSFMVVMSMLWYWSGFSYSRSEMTSSPSSSSSITTFVESLRNFCSFLFYFLKDCLNLKDLITIFSLRASSSAWRRSR